MLFSKRIDTILNWTGYPTEQLNQKQQMGPILWFLKNNCLLVDTK